MAGVGVEVDVGVSGGVAVGVMVGVAVAGSGPATGSVDSKVGSGRAGDIGDASMVGDASVVGEGPVVGGGSGVQVGHGLLGPEACCAPFQTPTECHRRLLIGRVLGGRGVEVIHVRGDGRLQSDDDEAEDHAYRDHAAED